MKSTPTLNSNISATKNDRNKNQNSTDSLGPPLPVCDKSNRLPYQEGQTLR